MNGAIGGIGGAMGPGASMGVASTTSVNPSVASSSGSQHTATPSPSTKVTISAEAHKALANDRSQSTNSVSTTSASQGSVGQADGTPQSNTTNAIRNLAKELEMLILLDILLQAEDKQHSASASYGTATVAQALATYAAVQSM